MECIATLERHILEQQGGSLLSSDYPILAELNNDIEMPCHPELQFTDREGEFQVTMNGCIPDLMRAELCVVLYPLLWFLF